MSENGIKNSCVEDAIHIWQSFNQRGEISSNDRELLNFNKHSRKFTWLLEFQYKKVKIFTSIAIYWVYSFEMTSNFRISKNLEDRSSNFPNFRKALFQFRILLWKVRKTIFRCLYFWGKKHVAFPIDINLSSIYKP